VVVDRLETAQDTLYPDTDTQVTNHCSPSLLVMIEESTAIFETAAKCKFLVGFYELIFGRGPQQTKGDR
jgi:hypothetical protein